MQRLKAIDKKIPPLKLSADLDRSSAHLQESRSILARRVYHQAEGNPSSIPTLGVREPLARYIGGCWLGRRTRNSVRDAVPCGRSTRLSHLKFYRLHGPGGPWGDYGDILTAGMSSHLPRQDGRLQLERTGPFMPAVTFPGSGHIVIADKVRMELEGSGLTGAVFAPVIKRHIVKLDWRSWPLDAAEPMDYPTEGEPENYILDRPHDPDTALSLGDIWEVQLGIHAETTRVERRPLLRPETWDGTDLFNPAGTRIPAASDRAAEWLSTRYPEWVRIAELETDQG